MAEAIFGFLVVGTIIAGLCIGAIALGALFYVFARIFIELML